MWWLSHTMAWIVPAAEAVLAVPVLYLGVVAAAAISVEHTRRRRAARATWQPEPSVPPLYTFAILVPAHNEEQLLGDTLRSLSELVYPKDRYTVYVVADNCTDRTAAVARAAGNVRVYERTDETRRSKGYALQWLLQALEADGVACDAYAIIDADTVVEPGYLSAMARELARGARALQPRYSVLNAGDSPSTVLRSIALTLFCHVRPLGRNALGGSSYLTNGVCLSRSLLLRHPWQAYGLTEDYAYYLTLIQHGERVRYVPDAVVLSPMPTTFAQMRSQDVRWESRQLGRQLGEPLWRKAWRLLSSGIGSRDLLRAEAAIELLTPPLSALVFACVAVVAVALWLASPVAVLAGIALTGVLACYVGSALYMLRPSPALYRAMLYAPGFMAWKVWVYVVLRRRDKYTREWVRTTRGVPTE